ncbi:MAG: DUF6261 family protein [Tannerellaceae bacterium]|jgi:hypothetical protein|nr:DUF6261 family protein [Tannerellaceae bacterium]
MKLIKKFKRLLHLLRNNEHFDFFRNIIDFVKGCEANIQEIQAPWKVLSKQFEREDDIYKRSAKASETKYIVEANRKRGDSYMMLRRSIEAASYSQDAKVKEAAVKLNEVIENYKTASSAPMTEVTSLVYNMVEDLRKTRYSEAITVLSLESEVDSLEATNEEFNKIYSERVQAMEHNEEQGNMREIRRVVDTAFATFADSVNALYTITKLAGTEDGKNTAMSIITFINGYIDQYEHIYAHRTPGHTMPDNDKPSIDDDDEFETPETQIPVLAVASQEVNSSASMSVYLADQAAFAKALYPIALEGTMTLVSDEVSEAYRNFPIFEFEMEDDRPVGFSVFVPRDGYTFDKPLHSMGNCHAEIYKDDQIIAILTDMQWPATTGS